MARTAKGGLSKHPTKGYRCTVGKKPDGKPKLFWLGHDRFIADWNTQALRDQFKRMKATGREVWTDDDVALVKRVVEYISRQRVRNFEDLEAARRATAEMRESVADG